MAYETIIIETKGRVGIVRLNRPQALNALNSTLNTELGQAIAAFDADDGIGCILIAGSEKAFAAGADIKEMAGKTSVEMAAEDYGVDWHATAKARKPVVAAVAGFALGGGCELVLQCDVVIAAETAKFGQPEVKLGICPGYGGTQRLPRLIGKGRAMQLLLTGEMIDAAEAYRIGLVNKVVPAADLLSTADAMLRTMLANGPLALGLCIEAVNRGYDASLEDGLNLEANHFALLSGTKDMAEGTAAFLAKRPPAFEGR
jgi:enoyl-CoA hydratase/carnithine racemase